MNYHHGFSAAILGIGVALPQVQAVQALSKAEISRTAQSITVMIQDAQNPKISGSGVIIKQEGPIYTVLTAQHVVQSPANFKVMTPDGKQHPVIQGSIKAFPDVDLALIQFTSAEVYSIAKMGNSDQSPLGTASFVAGFPGTTVVRSEPTFYFTSGEIAANANRPLKDGYAIAYNNPTLPGMSGGPVLNGNGELIGIHGRAENAAVPQNMQLRRDIYVLKTEFNYAVPINTFLRTVPKVNNALAFQVPSTPASSALEGDDFFLQADAKLKQGDYKGALTDFDQVLRLNPKYEAAYTGRGVAKSNLGNKKGAIDDLNQALLINPNNVRAYGERGSLRFQAGDKKGAEADLKQSLTLNIDAQDYRAYINRGNLRDKLGDKQGAIADYDQAIRINPNDAIIYSNRGVVRVNLGDQQGAIADFDQAILVNPNDAQSYINRGELRHKLGYSQKAIADFDQAIRVDPNNARLYVNRGNVRYALADRQGAIADYDQAIQINPKEILAYNNRGLIRLALADKEGAISDLKRAASLFKEQGNIDAYQGIIEKLHSLGSY
jgi:tetratricopeptide (TPR) repeat protein